MIRSLRARLFLASVAAIAAGLLAAGLAIAGIVGATVTRAFDARLEAALATVAAGLSREEEGGALRLEDLPLDPRFEQPLSGWYWQVDEAGRAARFVSGSLWNATLAGAQGPAGEALRLQCRRLTVPGGGAEVTVLVAAPAAALEEELDAVRRPVMLVILLLGLSLGLVVWVQIGFGLAPLVALRRDVADMRAGRIARLPEARFAEVATLTAELNALLDHQARATERAMRQAGDLAHQLKTPLAAIVNAAAEPGRDPEGVIWAAAERMSAHLRFHLQRARILGGAGLPGLRCPVGPVLEDLIFLMRRAHAARGIEITLDADGAPDFAGHREDLELMAGNLLDNACKWARSRVAVRARGTEGRLVLEVADDGPGLPEAQRGAALVHGLRFDERVPGHGFGLAIVVETAGIYGGSLALADNAPGLAAALCLPAVGRS
ncbi:MAG: sensor histidine kinase [Acetobacteraceae bacterium]|nr:sensor histidine kinase [Acetobacteraceae bacterium]